MKIAVYICVLIFGDLMLLTACRKPYIPPAITVNSNYLVVEGLINTGQDSTIIKLSRTVMISSTIGIKAELNASVIVESDANASYPLTETGNGTYSAPALNLSASNKYRLKIVTSDNKTYRSDFVPVKNSPPIDSVYYLVKSNGVQINVDSHDQSNNTRYYRWDFNDTWIIHSAFESYAEVSHFPKDTILYRPDADQIYTCWINGTSNTINLGSTATLSQDVTTNNEISFISSTSEKLGSRYSILVKQYAITKDAFDYWQLLKNNTEQLGSIFDPLPSTTTGNIHCITNPSEPVIGYISAGSYSQKRIFIDNYNLPAWRPITPNAGCKMDSVYLSNAITKNNDVAAYIYSGSQIPILALYVIKDNHGVIVGYTGSIPSCVDCTLRGTNKQPTFWINR